MIGPPVVPVRFVRAESSRDCASRAGIIEEELDPLPMAFVGQHSSAGLSYRVCARQCSSRKLWSQTLRTRRDAADVMVMYFIPAALASATPRRRVKFLGIKERWQPIVLINLEMSLVKYPLSIAQHAVHAPVT